MCCRSLGPEVYVAWKANLLQPDAEGRPTSLHSHHSTRHDVSRKGARFTGASTMSGSRAHTTTSRLPLTSHQAATKIQRFWRKHIDMQVRYVIVLGCCVQVCGRNKFTCGLWKSKFNNVCHDIMIIFSLIFLQARCSSYNSLKTSLDFIAGYNPSTTLTLHLSTIY